MAQLHDYGMLSDCHTAALVSSAGSIDWLCMPRFDAPSIFARLLDNEGGHWSISPTAASRSTRRYLEDSLVLETSFETSSGRARLTDSLLLGRGERGHLIGMDSPHVLVRTVEGVEGEVEMRSFLSARFEYALTRPIVEEQPGCFSLVAGPTVLLASSSVPAQKSDEDVVADFTVRKGERVWFALSFERSFGSSRPPQHDPIEAQTDTLEAWRSWSDLHWRERKGYDGVAMERVRRSALVLQGLTYQPSGAIVAAPTTSLPERGSGGWNWDYRYCWLRDSSMMMRSLWIAACPDEPQRFFDWIVRAEGGGGDTPVQIVFGVEGERDLTEHELRHLDGYTGITPVRVGNDAWQQRQLDVLGEVLDAAELLDSNVDEWTQAQSMLLREFANRAAELWRRPDYGMWELRDEMRQYTSSKVMCWVALDRAVRLAERIGADNDTRARWTRERDEIRRTVLNEAWSESAKAFTAWTGADSLDVSVLLMPLVGFLPATHPKMLSTINTIAEKLDAGGPLRRWESEPNGFMLAGFWLASCFALAGDHQRARNRFDMCTSHANDLGLLAEEASAATGEPMGNFPQAFSHVGLIGAAWDITRMQIQQAEKTG